MSSVRQNIMPKTTEKLTPAMKQLHQFRQKTPDLSESAVKVAGQTRLWIRSVNSELNKKWIPHQVRNDACQVQRSHRLRCRPSVCGFLGAACQIEFRIVCLRCAKGQVCVSGRGCAVLSMWDREVEKWGWQVIWCMAGFQ